MSATPVSGSGRETRILLLVIVVAVAMLLVLAQFRYPGPDRAAVLPAAGPIERLAARATFEELALIMADLSTRVQPELKVIVIEQIEPAGERRAVPALRLAADQAVAYLPAGFRVADQPGIEVVGTDEARALVLVRTLPEPFNSIGAIASGIGGPGYVAVIEGARGGPALRPLFIGRIDSFDDPRWTQPVQAIGGDAQVRAGAFIYMLDGRLVGLVVPDDAGVAIIRAPALFAAVEVLRPQ